MLPFGGSTRRTIALSVGQTLTGQWTNGGTKGARYAMGTVLVGGGQTGS